MSFDPMTMAIISAVGTVISGVSAYQQGQYQKKIAEYNARTQENAAIRERNAAIEAERDRKLQARALAARQQAALAAKGVDIGAGSSLDLIEDTTYYENVDLFRIQQNADARVEARQQQAALDRAEGEMAAARGTSALAGSLLTAGTKVAGAWYQSSGGAGDDPWDIWKDRRDGVWMGL